MRFPASGGSSGDVDTHLHISEDGDDIPGVLGRSSGRKELVFWGIQFKAQPHSSGFIFWSKLEWYNAFLPAFFGTHEKIRIPRYRLTLVAVVDQRNCRVTQ